MRLKLIFASTITLGILLSFVFFIFYLIAFWAQAINIWILVGLTVLTNFIIWLISPYLTDWVQKVFYKIRWVTFEELSATHKEVAGFIKEVCEKNRIKIPKIRIIGDANPTAYCYGSYPSNARMVLSEGIFKYLDTEEQKSVVTHELGHIVNKDFIIMTIAATLIQILYEIYYNFTRQARYRRGSSRDKKGDITPLIGIASYILYIIGSYLLLYLSRTREYLADRFAAVHTKNPDALSMALVKIAYGIAVEVDTESTQRLLASTRAMGIYDFKAAHSIGTVFKMAVGKDRTQPTRELTKVFLFDVFSPWAFVAEMNSTHPLTGKRIKALSQYAKEIGESSKFDFEKVVAEEKTLDKKRLYKDFFKGVIIYFLPMLAGLLGIGLIMVNPFNYPLLIALVGASLLLQGLYKFRRLGKAPEKTTVFELMQDPYANPLRGRFVEIEGRVIGKAEAGSYMGEDVKMEDKSGCLIYLNYESIIPIIGNIIFGLGKAQRMIGEYCKSIGWFRRSSYQVVDLDRVEVSGSLIKSYTRFWGIIAGLLFMIWGLVLYINVMPKRSISISPRPFTYTLIGNIDQINFNEPSGIVYHPSRKTLFVVGDEGDVCEIKTNGTFIKQSHIRNADFEGITCNPKTGLLYIAVEGEEKILEIDPEDFKVFREFSIERTFEGKTVLKAGGEGIEAITFVPDLRHPEGGTFYVVNQGFDLNDRNDPSAIFEVEAPIKSTSAEQATAKILRSFYLGIVDFSGLCYNKTSDHIYVISDETDTLLEITKDGKIVNSYAFPGDDQEGIAVDPEEFLYIAQDSGGIIKLKWNK